MADTLDLTVRLSGDLKDFVMREIDGGSYESADEYIRDLLRRRREETEYWSFEETKAELQRAFSAPRERYAPVTREDIFASYKPK